VTFVHFHLEEDVDDGSVAEEADEEEDPVGEARHMPNHGVLHHKDSVQLHLKSKSNDVRSTREML
jgi:hypothetical protein